jgi:hypothetical protein
VADAGGQDATRAAMIASEACVVADAQSKRYAGADDFGRPATVAAYSGPAGDRLERVR